MSTNSLREVTGDLDGPSCHVCGAIMVHELVRDNNHIANIHRWKCLSCGTHTGCTEPREEQS